MFGQHKVELFGETLMNFNILLSYKGSAVLTQGPVAPAQVPGPQVPGPHPLVLHFAPTAMCVYICIYIYGYVCGFMQIRSKTITVNTCSPYICESSFRGRLFESGHV